MSVATDQTNAQMWNESQKRFQSMLEEQMASDEEIDAGAIARTLGILEAAAVIEDMKSRAERAPTPCQEVINLLDVLLQQVMSLMTVEGGEK